MWEGAEEEKKKLKEDETLHNVFYLEFFFKKKSCVVEDGVRGCVKHCTQMEKVVQSRQP